MPQIRRGDLKTRYFFFPRKGVAVKQSAGKGKRMRNVVICMTGLLILTGCSIIKAARQPLDRPPEKIIPGRTQKSIDRIYGCPVAVGMSEDGKEYIEQLQFVDGIPCGWKITRIVVHSVLDSCTWFLWEFVGFPIELLNSDYPEYIYYVVYDDNNNVIKAVSQDSVEGHKYASLPWSAPRQKYVHVNRPKTVERLSLEERIAAAEKIANEAHKSIQSKKVEKKESICETSLTNEFSRLTSRDIDASKSKKKVKNLAPASSVSTIEAMLKEGLITKEEYERIKK